MLMDDQWDLKSHPYLDPKGENNLNAEREVPLRNVQYVEQRIKNVYQNKFNNHQTFSVLQICFITQNRQTL